jgi:hypothetical protein
MAKINKTKRLKPGGKVPEFKPGEFDLDSARNAITSDTSMSNGQRNRFLHKLDKVKSNITDLKIGVNSDTEGPTQWRWADGTNDASRFGGVVDNSRTQPFGGKGALGLSGGGYDDLLDYMVHNKHFKSLKPTEEAPKEIETPTVGPVTTLTTGTSSSDPIIKPDLKRVKKVVGERDYSGRRSQAIPPLNSSQLGNYQGINSFVQRPFDWTPNFPTNLPESKPFTSSPNILLGYPVSMLQSRYFLGGILAGIGKLVANPMVQQGLQMGQAALQVAKAPQPVEGTPAPTGGMDIGSIASIVEGILKKKSLSSITPMEMKPVDNIPTGGVVPQLAPMMAKGGAKLVTRKIVKAQYGTKAPRNKFLDAAGYAVNLALGMHPGTHNATPTVKDTSPMGSVDFSSMTTAANQPTPWKPLVLNFNEPGLGTNAPALPPLVPKPSYQVGNVKTAIKDMPGTTSYKPVAIAPGGANTVGKAPNGLAEVGKGILNNINAGDLISSIFTKPKSVTLPDHALLKETEMPVAPIIGLSYQDENRMKNSVAETRSLIPRSSDINSSIVTGRANADVASKVLKGVGDANAQAINTSTQMHRQDVANNIQEKARVSAGNNDIIFQNQTKTAQGKLADELAIQKWKGDSLMRVYNRGVVNTDKAAYQRRSMDDMEYSMDAQDNQARKVYADDLGYQAEKDLTAAHTAYVADPKNAGKTVQEFMTSVEAAPYIKKIADQKAAVSEATASQRTAFTKYKTNAFNNFNSDQGYGNFGNMFFPNSRYKSGGLLPRFKAGGSTMSTEDKIRVEQVKQEASSRKAERKLSTDMVRNNIEASKVGYLHTKRITDSNENFFRQLVPRRR